MRIDSGFGGHSADDSEFDQMACDFFRKADSEETNDFLLSDGISLRCLLETATFFQCDDVVATGLALRLDGLRCGEVAVFRAGEDDPLEFSAVALAQGAAAILTDQLLPCPLPQVIVGDVESVAGEIMHELCGRPSEQLMMIGIVGNAGKTTAALMIAGALRGLGIRTAYETDLGASDGIVQTVDQQSNARGAALVSRLSDARDAGCGAAVVEFTSELAAVHAGIKFDLLVVTGSSGSSDSADRSDHHFGPDPLLVALENLAHDGVVIAPADHPKLVRRVDDSGHKRLTYGLRREADLTAKVFDSQPGETTLMVSCGDETAAMETKHCGEAMAMNQLAAIAVAVLLETSLIDAIETVSQLPIVPGRLQRICGFDRASIVLDAGGDWSRVATTLRALRQQRGTGKLWCIMTLDQSTTANGNESLAICGRLIERYSDRVVLTSTDECKPNFLQSAHSLLDGFREVTVARLVADRKRAIEWAVRHAGPSDTILVLGGTDGATAHERRSRIQALEKLVEQCQAGPAVKQYDGPPTISMNGIA